MFPPRLLANFSSHNDGAARETIKKSLSQGSCLVTEYIHFVISVGCMSSLSDCISIPVIGGSVVLLAGEQSFFMWPQTLQPMQYLRQHVVGTWSSWRCLCLCPSSPCHCRTSRLCCLSCNCLFLSFLLCLSCPCSASTGPPAQALSSRHRLVPDSSRTASS